MSYFIKVVILIVIVILVAWLKYKLLSEKWLKGIIGVPLLLVFVMINIPIASTVKHSITGVLYAVFTILVLPTNKMLDYLKRYK